MPLKRHWLGIHDHANSINNWLLEDNQYSWLRTFERLSCKTSALLKINNNSLENFDFRNLRQIDYYFRDTSSVFWSDIILKINPTHILWNICYYKEALPLIIKLRKHKRKIFHCIRIHHDVFYLYKQESFLEFLEKCDHIILPTEKQKNFLIKLKFKNQIDVLPFGIDNDIFNNINKKNKDITFISACNKHPLRNYILLKLIYFIFNVFRIKSKNIIGYSRYQLSNYLQRSKFFFLTSLTEASGSRILLEAISSGCYPIILEECDTAVQIIKEHKYGEIIKSNFKVKMPQKLVIRKFKDCIRIFFILLKIKRNLLIEKSPPLLEKYFIKNEIKVLYKILSNL